MSVDNTERMRISSDGSVGIGTSSPDSYLAEGSNLVVADSGHTGITLASGTTSEGGIFFADGTSGADRYRGIIRYNHNANYMEFRTDAAERMRIDSSGNVGIGTASPARKFHVYDAGAAAIKVQAGDANQARLDLQNTAGSFGIITNNGALRIYDDTNGSERMRIDSAGNVLIGKTVSGSNNIGFETSDNGQAIATTSGTSPLLLNRKSSDGDIILFRKDGSNVGSIGCTSGSMYIEGNPSTGKSGLTFYGSSIEPRDNGASSNGAIDIGSTGAKFKDGHFSGTVNAGLLSSNRLSTDYKKIYGLSSGSGDNYYFLGSLRLGTQTDGYADIVIHRSVDHGQSEATKTVVNLSQRSGTLSTGCQVYGNLSNGNNIAIKVYQDGNDLDVYLFCDDYGIPVVDITHRGGGNWQTSQGSSVTPTGTEVYDSNDEVQFIINESGNFGIGTASPEKKLHIFDTSQSNQSVRFGNPNATPYGEINYNSTGTEHLYIRSKGTTTGYGNIVFETGSALDERMRINADGDTIFTLSTNATGKFADNISEVGSGNFCLQVSNSGQTALEPLGFRAEDIRFATGSSERMRIDSSGNVLIGKTSSGIANVGVEARQNGLLFATADSTDALKINRLNSDGTVAEFRKDGSTVGSIGTRYSTTYIRGDNSGILFNSNGTIPTNSNGEAQNNTRDLGQSTAKWKDGHFGGTVNANAFVGDGSGLTGISGGGGYKMTVFTSSGTYTKSSGVKDIKVTVTGGGGGNTRNSCGAGGGGAGATAIEFFDASSVSSTVSVTVGSGGLSRKSGDGYGQTGGTSSFGSYCSATGGGSSHSNSYKFGAGGTATGGTINIRGADGDAGTNGSPRKGGAGGGSYWGGGGAGGSDNSVGKNGIAYGAGGGATGQCTSNGTAGDGMQGVVVVEEFF